MKAIVDYIADEEWGELWRYLIDKLGSAFVILLLGCVIVKIIMFFTRRCLKRSRLDPSAHTFVISCTRIGLIVLLFSLVLAAIGVETASLVAAIGSCGVAVALALKDSLSNVAGGIIIIITKRFGKGDYVSIDGFEGTVEKVDLMSTTLITTDGKCIVTPNGTANKSITVNYSKTDRRRVDCVFSIARDDDIMKAKRILYKIAESNILVIDSPKPVVAVKELGVEYVDLACYVWCRRGTYYDTAYSMQEQVVQAFKEAGIRVPHRSVVICDDRAADDGVSNALGNI